MARLKYNTPFRRWLWRHFCLSANCKFCFAWWLILIVPSVQTDMKDKKLYNAFSFIFSYCYFMSLVSTFIWHKWAGNLNASQWTGLAVVSLDLNLGQKTHQVVSHFQTLTVLVWSFSLPPQFFVKKFWIKKRSRLMVHCDWEDLPGWKKGPCR